MNCCYIVIYKHQFIQTIGEINLFIFMLMGHNLIWLSLPDCNIIPLLKIKFWQGLFLFMNLCLSVMNLFFNLGALVVMCSCWTVNVIFTVTNAVLFPLHTLSLLLICLLCICKYFKFLLLNLDLFSYSLFPVDNRAFSAENQKLLFTSPPLSSLAWIPSLVPHLNLFLPSSLALSYIHALTDIAEFDLH